MWGGGPFLKGSKVLAPTPHTGALAEAKLLPLERKLQFGSFYDSPDAREAGAEWVCLDFGCLALLRLVEREAPPKKKRHRFWSQFPSVVLDSTESLAASSFGGIKCPWINNC